VGKTIEHLGKSEFDLDAIFVVIEKEWKVRCRGCGFQGFTIASAWGDTLR
jgi:stress response protein SCP2